MNVFASSNKDANVFVSGSNDDKTDETYSGRNGDEGDDSNDSNEGDEGDEGDNRDDIVNNNSNLEDLGTLLDLFPFEDDTILPSALVTAIDPRLLSLVDAKRTNSICR